MGLSTGVSAFDGPYGVQTKYCDTIPLGQLKAEGMLFRVPIISQSALPSRASRGEGLLHAVQPVSTDTQQSTGIPLTGLTEYP